MFLPGQQPSIQGFEAGFDEKDQFKHLVVDPGDLTTKLQNPGILYVALSRAKTIGTVSPNELHPKDSAIFWTGSGICTTRVLNVTQKRGLDGNMTNCLKNDKRQKWVDHLFEQNCITSTKQYNEKRLKKNRNKTSQKYKMNEEGGLTNSNCNYHHQSKQKMEETQK